MYPSSTFANPLLVVRRYAGGSYTRLDLVEVSESHREVWPTERSHKPHNDWIKRACPGPWAAVSEAADSHTRAAVGREGARFRGLDDERADEAGHAVTRVIAAQ
jgi:hypothetical protein